MRVEKRGESGFALVSLAVVVLAAGVAIFAAPKFTSAMRQHRLDAATRQLADLLERTKTQAAKDSMKASVTIDAANHRIGFKVYNADGTTARAGYLPLPSGVVFGDAGKLPSAISGASAVRSVSFPGQAQSSKPQRQDNDGALKALYLTNGQEHCAVTVNGFGDIRTFQWESGQWSDLRR